MAKKLALEKLRGNRATVNRDQALGVSRRMIVKLTADQLFTDAGLAPYEHRRIGVRALPYQGS